MKKFTIENLKGDDFSIDRTKATLLKEAGVDIPNALKAHNITELQWAIVKGYDCQSAWIDDVFTWDERGAITATVGHGYTAMVGIQGTAKAGRGGLAISDYEGTSIVDFDGIAIAGCRGIATAGNRGTAITGPRGTATAKNEGKATTGRGGAAKAGNFGTATAGKEGTAEAGEGGIIQIEYYDYDSIRTRIKTGYVGEDGLLPNTPYKLDENHNFVKATV